MSKVRKASVQVLLLVLALGIAVGFAWAAGDWSAAQSKVEELKKQQKELRELSSQEMRRLVTAVCDVDEDERLQVGRDAASRVTDKTNAAWSDLERLRDDTSSKINDVLADANLKDRHEAANRLKDELADRWKSIEKMAANKMRFGNHPIVAFMAQKGMDEHKNYQSSSSNCHASEFVTGRKADCLQADGDTCYVIELKPNNRQDAGKRSCRGPERAACEDGEG